MNYGKCDCGGNLEPIWFIEEEAKVMGGIMTWTGRKRKACSHLACERCMKNYCVGDSLDGPYR